MSILVVKQLIKFQTSVSHTRLFSEIGFDLGIPLRLSCSLPSLPCFCRFLKSPSFPMGLLTRERRRMRHASLLFSISPALCEFLSRPGIASSWGSHSRPSWERLRAWFRIAICIAAERLICYSHSSRDSTAESHCCMSHFV